MTWPAYYISDRIAIMLRGYVVEAGPVEAVLDNPLHPYSQLLKESIPKPQPTEKAAWVRTLTWEQPKSRNTAGWVVSSLADVRM